MPQYSNPFQEGEYPSAIRGIEGGLTQAMLEFRRTRAEEEDTREKLIGMVIGEIRERQRAQQRALEAEEQRTWREEEAEKARGWREEEAEKERGWREEEARKARIGRVTLKRTEPAPRAEREVEPGALTDQQKKFVDTHYKEADDLNALRGRITQWQRDYGLKKKLPQEWIAREKELTRRIQDREPRVQQILGYQTRQPVGATLEGEPFYQPTQQVGGYTMTTPEGQTITSEPELVAYLVSKGTPQDKIDKAVKEWRSRGGR